MTKRYGSKIILVTAMILSVPLAFSPVTSASETASDNVHTLLKTKSCRECALQGVDLNRADLAGADLEGADLAGAKLHLANLAGANLKNSNLQGAVFGGADLAGADLRGAQITKTTLDGAYVTGALLPEPGQSEKTGNVPVAAQKDADPVVAPVEQVENKAEISEPDRPAAPPAVASAPPPPKEMVSEEPPVVVAKGKSVKKAKDTAPVVVQEAEVEEQPVAEKTKVEAEQISPVVAGPEVKDVADQVAEQPRVMEGPAVDPKVAAREKLLDTKKCYGCDLSGLDLSGVSLKNGDLEKANLSGCNLSGTNLSKSNLKGTMIQNANLQNANLRGADLYKADLSGSDLTGADLKDAIFEDTELGGVTGMDR